MVRGNDPPGGAPADPNAAAPRVELLDPQGQLIQTIQLTLAGITVGRQPGNDLVLNAPIVSREHLRIDWDGRRAYVTDLSSRSGSRLAGALIPPDQRQVWAAGQPLQIGPYTLRLLTAAARASQQPDPLLSSLLGDPAAPLPGQSSSGEGRIAVALSPAQVALTLTPGQPTLVYVTIANHGPSDTLVLAIEGLPTTWIDTPNEMLSLDQGAQAVLPITITAPASPESRVREYPVTLRAYSIQNPAIAATTSARWRVRPFAASRLELAPRRARGQNQAGYVVRITNLGNRAARYTLDASDDEQVLAFAFAEPEVVVEPGKVVDVPLTAAPPQRIFGRPLRHTISVSASNPGEGTLTADGEFLQDPLVPIWALPAAGALLALLLICGFLPRPGATSLFAGLPIGYLLPANAAPLDPAAAANATARAVALATADAAGAAVVAARQTADAAPAAERGAAQTALALALATANAAGTAVPTLAPSVTPTPRPGASDTPLPGTPTQTPESQSTSTLTPESGGGVLPTNTPRSIIPTVLLDTPTPTPLPTVTPSPTPITPTSKPVVTEVASTPSLPTSPPPTVEVPTTQPEVGLAFAPAEIGVNQVADASIKMTIVLTNTNDEPLDGVTFTIDLAPTLRVADDETADKGCGGDLTIERPSDQLHTDTSSVTLKSGTIMKRDRCVVSMRVQFIHSDQPAGSYTFTVRASAIGIDAEQRTSDATIAIMAPSDLPPR
ncbi:MAG: FHA domain-containing protein [Kouleothrix sp.]|nr:FHA domain-containing protein [Kouleothrix sp.]